jgi:DNA mismatch repair protein MSH6
LEELEIALEAIKLGKERGMQLIFAKFLSMRSLWASLAQATAMLDALAALSEASSRSGFSRPQVCDCTPNDSPHIDVKQGRHPCVDFTHNGGDFIPNDLILGGTDNGVEGSRILLLR